MTRYKLYTTDRIIETNNYGDNYKYVLHREDGPAFIDYNTDRSIAYEYWYINGVKHREDGPAVIHYNDDGSIQYEVWYINGVKHREDGPAYIDYYKDGSIYLEEWYWCGLRHRHDYTKAACIYADNTCLYYWYGVCCKPEELLDKDFRDRIQLERLR